MAFYMEVNLNQDYRSDYKKGTLVKTNTRNICDLVVTFDIFEVSTDGYIVKNNLPNIKIPVQDTWDGWVEVLNTYYYPGILKIEKLVDKFRPYGFITLEECESYIDEFEKELKEFYDR